MTSPKRICSLSLFFIGMMNPAFAKKNEELEACKGNCKCPNEKARRVVKKHKKH